MQEGEFGSKVGWKEKGPFIKRGPHEQMHSLHTLVHPSVSGEQGCDGWKARHRGPTTGNVQQCQVEPHWSPRRKGNQVIPTLS